MDQGEVFLFKKHHAITEVFQEDILIFKDNLYIVPDEIDLNQFGQYEGYTHQGSLFFIAPAIDITERMDNISNRLSKEDGISYGITKVLDNSYLLRILGNEGEQLFNLFTEIRKSEDDLINRLKP
jgi:urease accessory protein